MGIVNSFLPYKDLRESSSALGRPLSDLGALDLVSVDVDIWYVERRGLADDGYGSGVNTVGHVDCKMYVSRWYENVHELSSC